MQMLLRIQAKRQCFFGFPHPFQDESFKRLRNEKVKSQPQMQNDGGLSRTERELRNYQTVGGIRKLGEESGDELESVFELARIDGVPNGSDTPLRYPTGQPELGRHKRGFGLGLVKVRTVTSASFFQFGTLKL